MKKISLILILFAMICGNVKAQWDWSYYAAISFASGTGTLQNPYTISTPEQLAFLAKQVNSGATYSGQYIRLEADLDLGAHNWISIGTYSNRFRGTFNGNGKTIKNMTVSIRYTDYDCHGLFGAIQDADISNLSIVDCDVQGGDYVGGLAGYAGASIINCNVTGTVSGYNDYIGGLVGYTFGTISNCHSEANINGGSYVGGLAGFISSNISGCSATGNVKGLLSYVGGLVGYMEWSMMTDCYATGAVTGFRYVGGLIGSTNESCTVTGCFAVGAVTGYVPLFGSNEDIGGLIGTHGLDCRITECFASGSVSGDINVGGLAGRSSSSLSIENCYAVGTVTGFTSVGGLTGEDGTEEVINCYTAGAVVGTSNWGGFSGTGTIYYASCFFDYQATGTYQGIGNNDDEFIEPFPTSSFTDGDLPGAFAISGIWQAVEGYYPQLTRFANHSNPLIREWSALSVTPLFLANTEEFCSNVKSPFSLFEKSASGANISWSISPDVYNSVDNYRVTCNNQREWNRLTLSSGVYSRTIAFRSEKGFGDADLLGFVFSGKRYPPQSRTKIVIDCSSTSAEISVQLEMSKFASASTGSVITVKTDKPDIFTYDITIKSVDESKSQNYTLEVEKPFSSNIFVQRWPDVLAINNNFVTNGGYNFTAYEWFKNDGKLPDNKGYIQTGGSSQATFTAIVTTQQGDKLGVCPIIISNISSPGMAVFPNPVRRGQTVYVETGISTNALIQLFDTRGNLIAKQTLRDPVAEIVAPDMPGTYILQITENGAAQTFKIAVE